MNGTDAEYRSHGDVGQFEIGEDLFHQSATGLWGRYFFPHVEVQYRAARVLALEVVLKH